MAVTPHDIATSLSFAGVTYTVTSVTYSTSDVGANDTIDVSHLGQSAGASVLTIARPLKGGGNGDTGREIQFDYLGTVVLADGATGTLELAGPVTVAAAGTVVASSVTLAVNDVVKGSATIRIARV